MESRTKDVSSDDSARDRVDHRRLGLVWARLAWGLWVPNWILYLRATLRLNDAETWRREPTPIPPGWFTRPTAPLPRYLYDRSTVDVAGLGDIHRWLRGCDYREELQGHPPDAWLPPSVFESTRRGTCTEHAAWAWHKLHDVDCDAELVVGELDDGEDGLHAWVVLEPGTESPSVFETTSKSTAPRLLDLETAEKEGYRPWYGVDTNLQKYLYRNFGGTDREV